MSSHHIFLQMFDVNADAPSELVATCADDCTVMLWDPRNWTVCTFA